jgi:hypothetical protein
MGPDHEKGSAALFLLCQALLAAHRASGENRFRGYECLKVRNASMKGLRFKSAMRSISALDSGVMDS